jgi:hypothetical protein
VHLRCIGFDFGYNSLKKCSGGVKFLLPKQAGLPIIVFVVMEIMRAPILPSRSIVPFFSCIAFFASAAGILAADVVLQKVPPLTVEQAPSYPENLARYALGAQIEIAPSTKANTKLQLSSMSEDNNASEAALLCDDPTIGYPLPNGATTIVVSLPNIENVESIAFLNHDAKGNVSIATSNAQLPPNSPQWHSALQQELTSNGVKVKIGPSEAKYVKLTFNVTQPGRIAGFGLYSTPAVADFTMPRPRKVNFEGKSESFALITSNLTDVHSRARALYVSSGGEVKDANNMIDDQPATTYTFARGDATPTAVIDLGKVCTLRRLSAIASPRKGNVDFYILNSLPIASQSESDQLNAAALQKGAPAGQTPAATAAMEFPQTVKITDAAFANLKPVASVATNQGEGRASVDFSATSGRYVMVRWNSAAPLDSAFAVAEIAAFGGPKPASQIIASNEDRSGGRFADGKTTLDGKTILDNKDIPAEGVEPQSPTEGPPPGLPQHPPFTFIPEIIPTSP